MSGELRRPGRLVSANHLTEKEKACLRGLAAGMSSRVIATELEISQRDVDDLIRNATEKLGAKSQTEAVHILSALEGNFVDAEDVREFEKQSDARSKHSARCKSDHSEPVGGRFPSDLETLTSDSRNRYAYLGLRQRVELPVHGVDFNKEERSAEWHRINVGNNNLSSIERILVVFAVFAISYASLGAILITLSIMDSSR